jgi:hypothetical protein
MHVEPHFTRVPKADCGIFLQEKLEKTFVPGFHALHPSRRDAAFVFDLHKTRKDFCMHRKTVSSLPAPLALFIYLRARARLSQKRFYWLGNEQVDRALAMAFHTFALVLCCCCFKTLIRRFEIIPQMEFVASCAAPSPKWSKLRNRRYRKQRTSSIVKNPLFRTMSRLFGLDKHITHHLRDLARRLGETANVEAI